MFLRHEYRDVGEQMRMRFDQIELLPQGRQVGCRAFTLAVETVGERDGVGHAAAFCSASRARQHHAQHGSRELRRDETRRVGWPDAGELSVSARPSVIAGLAKEVEAVNQYGGADPADTRQAAAVDRRATLNATTMSPAVATLFGEPLGESCAHMRRTPLDSGSSNMALASTSASTTADDLRRDEGDGLFRPSLAAP